MNAYALMLIPKRRISRELHVHTVGYEQTKPGKKVGPRVRDRYCIHFVFGGKGSFCGEAIRAGNCFLFCPDTVHVYSSDSEDPLRYGWVTFGGDNAEKLLLKCGLEPKNQVFEISDTEVIERYFRLFCNEDEKRINMENYLLGCLHTIFAFLMRDSENHERSIKKRHIETAIEFIENNYHRALTVDMIAAERHISSHYLSNIFKSELGTTPRDYLMSVRMKRAAELLSLDSLLISEIAHSVGYGDQLVFSKQFKKYHGLSPRDYREKAKNQS